MKKPVAQSSANEGEGSRTADRAYREGVKKFLEHNNPETIAREAAAEMEQRGKPAKPERPQRPEPTGKAVK